MTTSYIRVVQAATMRGDIDLIAVERSVNGEPPARMTTDERREAARILAAHGLTPAQIAARMHIRTEMLRRLLPTELKWRTTDRGPLVCGTARAYRHCRADNGRPCQPCRTANAVRDRARIRKAQGMTTGVAA